MTSRILGLGSLIASMSASLVIVACGNNSNGNNEVKNYGNTSRKTKATFVENEEYFQKTGYDPKRPLNEYNYLLLKANRLWNYKDDLVQSYGSKVAIMLAKYNQKFLDLREKVENNSSLSHSQKQSAINDVYRLFYDYVPSGKKRLWKNKNYIPCVELYDFAHSYELKEAKKHRGYNPKTNTWSNGWTNPFSYSKNYN